MKPEYELLQKEYGITPQLCDLAQQAEEDCQGVFDKLAETRAYNQLKVLNAFRAQRIAPAHFAPSYGYGYDDLGRGKLEALFAQIFGAEAALVRPSIASGTHALALALFGLLRRGDCCLSASGKPYDTLESVIGMGEEQDGSLASLGVSYRQLELTEEQKIDMLHLDKICREQKITLVMLQRSRGYTDRASLPIEQIREACAVIKKASPATLVMVDNCYGEFTDTIEPLEAGADIIVGSLIKNPGGGLAPTGGYIAGKAKLIEKISYRLTSPGIGAEVGSYAASYMPFFQGLFMAPHVVCEALKGAVFTARFFTKLGYHVSPAFDEKRSCIIQSIYFKSPEEVIDFCKAIQMISPVDSYVVPEPWDMPGYGDPVIMAAGTFIQGASIELSADAPIRSPYTAYMQGGLVYEQVKAAVMTAAQLFKE